MSVQSEIERIQKNVASTYSVLEQAGADMPQSRNTNNLAETAASIKAVLYGKVQNLADPQKLQARKNIGADYGTLFDSFPTEAQIRALPNNSFFTVNAFGSVDGANRIATYYRTTSWTRNSLRYKESDGTTTIYVVPVSQPSGEVYLPLYGIKTGEANAAANSAIMDTLLSTVAYGSTFKFPVGHFYFSKPIDASAKHISIVGTVNAGFKHINISGTTFLHFTNVAEGQTALTVMHSTVADVTIYGNESQYSMTLDRDEDSSTPNPTVSETVVAKAYGIKVSGNSIIRDVGVRNFYYGIWCEISNIAVSNISVSKCHYGLSVGNDVKCFNIWGSEIMVLIQMRGSIASATGVRGDGIGMHLVEITGGGRHTLTDLDADFCMGAIVAIGDGVKASAVSHLEINGVHGRASVSQVYASSAAEVTALDITAENAGDFGVLAVKAGSSLKGAIVITNQPSQSNPFDSVSGFVSPFVLLSAGADTIVQGVQFITTASVENETMEDWMQKRIGSCSALADACSVKVHSNNGIVNYSKSNKTVTIISEFVQTVNGIAPNANGNFDEPLWVESIAECVDTSKKYVLPDGYVYEYKTRFIPESKIPNFTNQLPLSIDPLTKSGILNGVGYKNGVFYSPDANEVGFRERAMSDLNLVGYSTGLIPVKNGDIVRVNTLGYSATTGEGAGYALFTIDTTAVRMSFYGGNLSAITSGGGKYATTGSYNNSILSDVEIHINEATFGWRVKYNQMKWVVFMILSTTPPEDVAITVNEEITYTVTEAHYESKWENTGVLYGQPNYLGMIRDLQNRIAALEDK